MRQPFMKLHRWLHSDDGPFFTWPDWWCSVLNVLGGSLCVSITASHRAFMRTPSEPYTRKGDAD